MAQMTSINRYSIVLFVINVVKTSGISATPCGMELVKDQGMGMDLDQCNLSAWPRW